MVSDTSAGSLSSQSPNWHLCALILLLTSAAFATFSPVLLGAFLVVGLAIALLHVSAYRRLDLTDSEMVAIIAAVTTASLGYAAFKSPTAIYHFVVVVLALALAMLLTRNPSAYVRGSLVTLLIGHAAIVTHIAREGLSGFPLETMIDGVSSNGVTSLLFVVQFNYTVANFLLNRKASLFTAAVTLGVCFIGFGRGSIIAAAGLLTISLIFSISPKNRMRWLVGAAILVGAALLVVPALFDELTTFVNRNTKLAAGLVDRHRLAMILDYAATINGVTIFLGSSFDGTIIETKYNGNPHNAFIRAHSIFGLPYLIVMLLLPLYLIIRQASAGVGVYVAGMFLVLMFRAFTEPILFPTPFDLYYFALCIGLSGVKPVETGHPIARSGG